MSLSYDQLLTWLLLYGYPVLFVAVLVGSLGVPIPLNVLVLAAGGFVADGDMALIPVALVVFTAAVLGDCTVYGVSRWAGEEAVHRHGGRVGLSAERLAAVRARFGTWLGLAVFTTRWLLTPVAFPTSIVAGVSRYPLLGFAGFAFAGEAIWAGAYLTLGYVFGQSWSGISDYVQDSAWVIAGIGLVVVALVLLVLVERPRRHAVAEEATAVRSREAC